MKAAVFHAPLDLRLEDREVPRASGNQILVKVEASALCPTDVRIYRNVYTCCGVGGLGLIIEVVGPEEWKIKEIDLRAVSKILEFCEKEGLDVGHHTIEKRESI